MQIELTLHPIPPYDFAGSLRFLGPSCPDPVLHFDGVALYRCLTLPESNSALISLKSVGSLTHPELLLQIEATTLGDFDVQRCAERIANSFCLNLDLQAFYTAMQRDEAMTRLCRRNVGMKPVLESNPFEALTWAIIGQQVNLRFACQVKRGMLECFGERRRISPDGVEILGYPKPSKIAGLDPTVWREFKCSQRKAEYVIGLANLIQQGFDLNALHDLRDEEIVAELIKIRGIGLWTAQYVLIQGFGRWDALPLGDAGLINGVRRTYGLDHRPTAEEITVFAENWRPYRGLATYYLWWGK